eukprot:CAMPEP_0194358380 /NCGR_PEP_ID=MMETSP0174-20130528/5606_1 /TAXON_ID=216777 /ORGANISM="Proboscia alata, Strain PI-D3" /LENGTH=180 /DNA_ID=CAMNT_0039128677 /DNA_START=336 /DNA_END=878 /DNA_ORIENTATION=+
MMPRPMMDQGQIWITNYSRVILKNDSSVPIKFVIEEEELTGRRVLNVGRDLKVAGVGLKVNETDTLERGIQKKRELEVLPGNFSTEGMQPIYIVHVSVHSLVDNKWLGPHFRRELNPKFVSKVTFMEKHRILILKKESSTLLDPSEESISECGLEFEQRSKTSEEGEKTEATKLLEGGPV